MDTQNRHKLALIHCTREPIGDQVLKLLDCRRTLHKACLLQELLRVSYKVWTV